MNVMLMLTVRILYPRTNVLVRLATLEMARRAQV